MRSNSSTSASWPAVKILPSVDRSIASQLARNASKASKSGFISFTASSSISPSLERNSTKRASIPPNGGKGLLFPWFRRSIEGVRSFALYSLIHAPFALAARSSLLRQLRLRWRWEAGEPAECATRFASSSHAARTPGREPFVRYAKWGPITGEIALADLITSQ